MTAIITNLAAMPLPALVGAEERAKRTNDIDQARQPTPSIRYHILGRHTNTPWETLHPARTNIWVLLVRTTD